MLALPAASGPAADLLTQLEERAGKLSMATQRALCSLGKMAY
jgi:hypothetical protein